MLSPRSSRNTGPRLDWDASDMQTCMHENDAEHRRFAARIRGGAHRRARENRTGAHGARSPDRPGERAQAHSAEGHAEASDRSAPEEGSRRLILVDTSVWV